MEWAILIEYGWVLIVLILLEGLLAADNALVLAVMVKHLPPAARKKALFYGLAGAFVFRFLSLFVISFLVDVWQIQAIGAIYLLFIAINHIARKYLVKKVEQEEKEKEHALDSEGKEVVDKKNFWWTVFKVELADIAFAVDSILAAVALAVTLPELGLGKVGNLDSGQFIVILLGGIIGLVIMRFAAGIFSNLLQERPSLETVAFLIVGWVGVKLAVVTASHPDIGLLDKHFAHSLEWKLFFWGVLLAIVIIGWFRSGKKIDKGTTSSTSSLSHSE